MRKNEIRRHKEEKEEREVDNVEYAEEKEDGGEYRKRSGVRINGGFPGIC